MHCQGIKEREMTSLLYQLVGQFIKDDEINECKTNC